MYSTNVDTGFAITVRAIALATGELPGNKKRRFPGGKRRFLIMKSSKRNCFVLGRPGSDLLSQGLSHSIIGAEEFNGRVRDGIGFKLLARTTRPAKDKETKQAVGLANSE